MWMSKTQRNLLMCHQLTMPPFYFVIVISYQKKRKKNPNQKTKPKQTKNYKNLKSRDSPSSKSSENHEPSLNTSLVSWKTFKHKITFILVPVKSNLRAYQVWKLSLLKCSLCRLPAVYLVLICGDQTFLIIHSVLIICTVDMTCKDLQKAFCSMPLN